MIGKCEPYAGVSGTSGREGSGARLSHPGIDEIVINGEKIKTSVSVSTSVATSVQKVRSGLFCLFII